MGYWMAGLVADAGAFFFFLLVFVVAMFTSQSLTMLMSAIATDFSVAAGVCFTLFAFMYLFSGSFMTKNQIPDAWYS